MDKIAVQDSRQGATFHVKVLPRSARTEVVGIYGGALKIRVKAPPLEGKANDEVVKFLSRYLGVKVSSVTIIGGRLSSLKTVCISDVDAESLKLRLAEPNRRPG